MKPVLNWFQSSSKISAKEKLDALKKDKQLLILEIQKAHRTWVAAQAHFEFALDKDQVDYAIYALEAAEKRYEMLLKQAKQLQVNLIGNERLMGG